MESDFYLRYYVGHKGKFGHEFLEFEFRPDGKSGLPPASRERDGPGGGRTSSRSPECGEGREGTAFCSHAGASR